MSGGVRNLRAMFENKDPTTELPNRGRSPGESIHGGASTGTSPRPLSKVRTSFVTVEKSGGQIGLRKQDSSEGSMTRRRGSFSMNEEDHFKETLERKESIAAEIDAREKNTLIKETIPENAIETPSIELDRQLGGSSAAGKKATKVEERKPAVLKPASTSQTNGTAKPVASSKPIDNISKPASRPSPISTAKITTSSKPSPTKAKTPITKTPTTPKMLSKDIKISEKEAETKISRPVIAAQSSKPTSKPPTATAHGSIPKTRIGASPPQTGFHKPRPKSPTRPIKLPASLIAHTASSGSKTATSAPPVSNRQSLSRASGNSQPTSSLQAHAASSRSPSRTSAVGNVKAAATRKPSTLKVASGRPSLGPPPAVKKQASRQSLASTSAPADDGFLARMMRPTTASASKTAEKPPTTPPKTATSVKRPAANDGPSKASPVAKLKEAVTPKPITEKVKAVVKAIPEKVTAAVTSTPKKADPKIAAVESVKRNEEVPETPKHVVLEEAAVPSTPIVEPPTPVQEIKTPEPMAREIEKPEGEAPKVEEVEVIEPVVAAKIEEPVVKEPVVKKPETPTKITAVEDSNSVPSTGGEADVVIPEEVEAATKSSVKETPAVSEPESKADDPPLQEETEEADAAASSAKTNVTKPATIEDPEDAKAREEINRINAEFMKSAGL